MEENLELEGENPAIEDAIDNIFNAKFSDFKTSMPAKIIEYNKDKQRASVKPLWLRAYIDEDGNEKTEEYPIINEVPIQFPRFGNYVAIFPIKKDDSVWLNFAERSLDSYLASDGKTVIDPIDGRMHNINDAYATPCFSTDKNAIINVSSDDFVIRDLQGETEIHLTPNKEVQIKASKVLLGSLTANKALALAEKVNQRCSDLENYVVIPHGSPVGPTVPTPFTGLKQDVSSSVSYTSN